MARSKRRWVSQDEGSYHIISRVAGGELLFNGEDKEYFYTFFERLASGFFVEIHAFAVMSNHFHILATGLEKDARNASKEELFRRYRLMYGKNADPPIGRFDSGQFIPDADGGEERLRRRLGSISSFVKELKQGFSNWYNKKYNRTGYLWGGRFKGVILSKGEAQLVCSAYIDLNPVRANIVKKPEDYRWSSLGLRVRDPARSHKLLRPLSILPSFSGCSAGSEEMYLDVEPPFRPLILSKKSCDQFATYREFVYKSGGLGQTEGFHIWPEVFSEVADFHGKFGVKDRLRYRIKNFSEGLALGNYALIADLQKSWYRKKIRPRSFMGRDSSCGWSFTTRVLRL
jgi:REP element-mobilizing transposase RayT